ncbi:hypothetical protein BC941DRAFT_407915 [Chlamydoabsidia padenii]|nr:hypothetical protein BC941DRAFT_407915 [Chlamydoabsidia padenii]
MTSLATKFMEKKAKKYATGRAADLINPTQQYINDPEIRAAQEEAAKTHKRQWWKRQEQPDIILSDRDRQVLRAVKRRATYLDKGCSCCCFTFGFDFVIGLIPVIGDAIGLILGLELIKVASKADLPKHLQAQMLVNVIFDFVLGLTPVIGDFLDAVVKCNWRNAMILEDYLMLRRRDEIRAEKGLVTTHHDGLLSPEPTTTGISNPHHVDPPGPSSSSLPPVQQSQQQQQNKKYGSLLPRF